MSLGLRLCASREGGTGGGGWVSALSLGLAWPLLGLALKSSWLELGGPFLSSFAQNGLRKQSSRLIGPPFLAVKRFSRSRQAMVGREPGLLNGP